MIAVIAILGVVSAALMTVIVVKVFKDSGKESKLDNVATVVKAAVDQAIISLQDGAQLDDVVTVLKAALDKIKDLKAPAV